MTGQYKKRGENKPAHRHVWIQRPPGAARGYDYRCIFCGMKSRNNVAQSAATWLKRPPQTLQTQDEREAAHLAAQTVKQGIRSRKAAQAPVLESREWGVMTVNASTPFADDLLGFEIADTSELRARIDERREWMIDLLNNPIVDLPHTLTMIALEHEMRMEQLRREMTE
jgi:hypothetical protein